jgi:uncharacterized protein YuzE
MKVEHDAAHDTAYFAIAEGDAVRQVKLDDGRIVDYAADGSVLGIEFIAPSRGLNLSGLPQAGKIAREAHRLGMHVRVSGGVAPAG